jgi:hypothetical protein
VIDLNLEAEVQNPKYPSSHLKKIPAILSNFASFLSAAFEKSGSDQSANHFHCVFFNISKGVWTQHPGTQFENGLNYVLYNVKLSILS